MERTVASIVAIEAKHPGSVALIEGPNEINNESGFGFHQNDHGGAQAYMTALYAAVLADTKLRTIPVAGFTDYPDQTSAGDYANFHYFPQGGAAPGDAMRAAISSQLAANPGKPLVCTEFGYVTDVDGVSKAVTEQEQARLVTAGLRAAFAAKVIRTYVYELFDTAAYGSHGGLFHDDGTPKPAATAVKALLTS